MATKNPSSSPRTPNASKCARTDATPTPASVVTSPNLLNAYFAKKILRENILPPPFPADTRAQVESLLASMDDSGRVNVARFLDAQQKASPIVARESITKGLGRLLEKINAAAQEKGVPFNVSITGAKKAGAANRWVSFYGPSPEPNPANTTEVDSILQAQFYQREGVFLLRDYTPIVALITFNEHETAAVQKQFCPNPDPRSLLPLPKVGITCQCLGKIEETWIIHCISGQGENRAQQTANALIAGFGEKLKAIIGVGIAFGAGLTVQEKGDVLVLENAYDYEMVKKAKKTEPRGNHYPASLQLLQRLKTVDSENKKHLYWPKIHFGQIASGNTLVDNRKYRDMLMKMAGAGAQGGEMEAIGISFAAELLKKDWIIVKAICDWGDGNKNAPNVNKEADQKLAAENAAYVVHKALSFGPLYPQDIPPEKQTIEDYQINKRDIEKITKEQLIKNQACDSTLEKNFFGKTGNNTSAIQKPEGVNVLDALDAWVQDPDTTHFFVLLGEYGMGKTISCQQFTKNLQEQLKTAPATTPLPLYFDLRHVSGLDSRVPTLAQTIEECIERGWLDHNGPAIVSLSVLYDTIEMRPAVFIFDGLDEVLSKLDSNNGQIFTRNLLKVFEDMENRRKKKGLSVPSVKVLVSCRTQFFRTLDDQQNHFTGQERRGNFAKAWTTMLLLPVNDEQVTTYLEATFPGDDISKIQEMIASVHNLKDLSQRPITLRWITELLPEIEKDRMEGKTINGATLYHHMALRWLERDAGKQHIEKEHKMKLATHLAAYLWKEKQNALPATEIETWFLKWLKSDEDIAIHYTNLHRDKLKEDLRNCTFLSRQDDKNGSNFRFAHTSLLEYFLAVHLHNGLQNDDSAAWEDLTPSQETLVFLIQQNQSSPAHIRKKVQEILLKYLARPQGNFVARQSWAELYFLAPVEWKAETLDISGLDFEGLTFTGLRLSFFRADNANLADTRWKDCIFTRSSWHGANCRQIIFENIEGAEADFSGANLHAGRWRKVTLQKQNFPDVNCERLQKSTCAGQIVNLFPQPQPEVFTPKHWRLQWERRDGHINACSLSADGQFLLMGSDDGTARLWNVQGEYLRILKRHSNWVLACSLSADGQLLLTGSADSTARLWNAQGKCLHILKGHTDWVVECSLSANGQLLLTASNDGTVRLWNAQGECLHVLKGHTGRVYACSLSANGQFLLTASDDGTARLWNAQGEFLHVLEGHTGRVYACSLSANGQFLLTASGDGTARLWNAQGECLHVFQNFDTSVRACNISADGQTLMIVSDNRVRLWRRDGKGWRCVLDLSPGTGTRVFLDAQTQTLKIDGPAWPFWQLHNVVDPSVWNRLGETIADFGPLAHEQLANGADWHFIPAPV
jgi:nucleoside phosphorylase